MSNDEILNTARYLRAIRPIDPAEVTQYVEGDIDASHIRAVLHRHAVSLGIFEREDGTFVPVPEEPFIPAPAKVDELPEDISETVADLLITEFGQTWFEGASGDRLREAIRAFKSAYFTDESVEYDRTTALGYAIYHLPGAYAKTQYVLESIGAAQLIPTTVRVLEVGPGVGGSALGLAEYLGPDWPIAYHGIETSTAAIDVAERLLQHTHRNMHWNLEHADIETADLGGPYDLILASSVLSELDHPVEVVTRLIDTLTEDGSLVAIEPADERTSRLLRRIERSVLDERDDLEVFAPSLRLWPNAQPRDDCWSFDERPAIEIPPFQRALDEGKRVTDEERDPATGEFVTVDIRYSYSILRRDGARSHPFRPSRARYAPLKESPSNVSNRTNLAVVKLSNNLAEPDRHPLYVIGDGSQRTEHFAVHTHSTELNRDLSDAQYGEILSIERGLLLWNGDEEAYNVVIDAETIVDRIAPM